MNFSFQRSEGGFVDKPGKSRDLYHTCYVLAGLAIAQQYSILKDGHIFGGDEARVVSQILL